MVLLVPRGFLWEQIEEKTKWVLANPGLLQKRPFKWGSGGGGFCSVTPSQMWQVKQM